MSVLGTTKYSLCNCIDTWQTRCIVLLVKKTKQKTTKKVFWDLLDRAEIISCKIFYTKIMQSFLRPTVKNKFFFLNEDRS